VFIARAFLLGTILASAAVSGDWQPVTNEDGIEVSEREVPGRSLPMFRGVGVIEADLYEVLAVIHDIENHTRWMADCVESRLLRRESESVSFGYNRTDSPWPVPDRDVVVRAETIVVEAGREVHSLFRSVADESVPPARRVVRMRHLEGHYKLWTLGPDRTRVEYQVDADPGSSLPAWLVRRTTRKMPLLTLLNLRKRVAETRGSYEEFLERWDPARSPGRLPPRPEDR
jgi:hypothetical protein